MYKINKLKGSKFYQVTLDGKLVFMSIHFIEAVTFTNK